MDSKSHERVFVRVDLKAIGDNISAIISKLSGGVKAIAVVKADAYGHGAVSVARYIESRNDIWGFGVATSEEAFELRDAGIVKPILLLGYVFEHDCVRLVENDITCCVFKEKQIKELSEAAAALGKICKVHIKVDTGMSRIGIFPYSAGLDFVRMVADISNIKVEGVFTHFAKADEESDTATVVQQTKFSDFLKLLREKEDLSIPIRHSGNSAAAMEFPEYCGDAPYLMNVVRLGISMYGLWPSREVQKIEAKKNEGIHLNQAISMKSCITMIKDVDEGQGVSYGGTFVTERKTKVATIPIGYADGYPRGLSNKGYVLVRGKRAKILGRICMDQFMVDVTDIIGAKEDDEVTIIGRDIDEFIYIEDMADMAGIFHYELPCLISKRVPRKYG